ncbi:hypothetical protein [Methylobacterium sp. GC_Met_2]|uniref:hypothetical protein n=1 Tax=Methylobacterium sp. GC_Met_2 TaxID=2937376 RepID=UPI00226B1CCA|nr:hypothetical protein [Methylobacterium sp. GC_Met_2]
MSVHTKKGAQENATASAPLIKPFGTLLTSTGIVASTEVARLVRAAEAEAASFGTAYGPAVAEIICEIGVDQKKAE